jgi:hypothetical protein
VASAVIALALPLSAGASPASPSPRASRFVAAQLPESVAGNQLRWLLEASARLPISDAELRTHFSKWFLLAPAQSPAELNDGLDGVTDGGGLGLGHVTLAQPNALAGTLSGRDGRRLQVALATDRTGHIDVGVLLPAGPPPQATLPAPTGRAAVGTDVVQVVGARHGRRLPLTRWYPAASTTRNRPRAAGELCVPAAVLCVTPARPAAAGARAAVAPG